MQKRTGINIQFIHPASGMEQEQFNLLMVSGELPDIIGSANFYKGGEFQGMYDGFFLDLTDLIPKYAPDYYKLISEDPEFFRQVSDDDGRICAFYAYKPPYGDPPFIRVILRKDVLEELGKDIPRTIADYDDLFAAMKDRGITPFLPPSNGIIRMFAGAFGVVGELYKDENGIIKYGRVQPEFKKYLEMMHRWYINGYISRDFTSVNINQTNTLFDTKKVGMIIGPIVANYNRSQVLGFEVTSAPYPRVNPGDQLSHEEANIWPLAGLGPQMAVLNARTRNPEAAIRWLNYAYTPEGRALFNWGVEGINYDVVDGEKIYNDLMLNNPVFGTEEASYIYKMHFAPKYVELDIIAHANLLKSPASLVSRMMWADDPNVDSSMSLPPYQLSVAEQNLRARIMTEINTYSDEMILKFITGAESLDNFNNYVNRINAMGLPEILKSEQAAYNRYLTKRLN